MKSLDEWIEAIASAPDDEMTWDVASDWCEEQNLGAVASVLRSPPLRERRPISRKSAHLGKRFARSFDWDGMDDHRPGALSAGYWYAETCFLPSEIFEALGPPENATESWSKVSYREYPTQEAALRALLKAVCSII